MKTGLQQASAFHSNLSLCKTSHSGLKGYIESKETYSAHNGANEHCNREQSSERNIKYRLSHDRAFRQKVIQTAVVGWAFFFLVSRLDFKKVKFNCKYFFYLYCTCKMLLFTYTLKDVMGEHTVN